MARRIKFILGLLFIYVYTHSQTHANFVQNGSFEIYSNCDPPFVLEKCYGWSSINSNSYCGILKQKCAGAIPMNIHTWQYPKSGTSYGISAFYYKNNTIGYPRNRLKQTLKANKTYCVKFYVNIANTSPRGIDSFGAYFADSSLDTITKCNRPLVYLTPQISNPSGNIISDTLNWVPITGTFVANGTEKYMVIGNFKSDAAVNTSTINGPFVSQEWCDVCIDDISCIEMDVAAYAGPDKRFIAGDSVYLGRELDFAVDPYCIWYQLPNMITAIDTASGIWVKPTITSTYVVRQELECNSVKWDTVVVYRDAVGLENALLLQESLQLSPQPAEDKVTLSFSSENDLSDYFHFLEVVDLQGNCIQSIRLDASSERITINTGDFINGLYVVRLCDDNFNPVIFKKLAVQH